MAPRIFLKKWKILHTRKIPEENRPYTSERSGAKYAERRENDFKRIVDLRLFRRHGYVLWWRILEGLLEEETKRKK